MNRLFFLSIACLFFCSCSSDIKEETTTGNIAGSVSDRTTGEPVATVNVTLTPSGKSTVTGNDGSFSFVDLAPGEYTVAIRKEGYNPNSGQFTAQAGRSTSAHLLIERIPAKITTDRNTLDYGEQYSVNTLSFNIVNSSYENLEWDITHSCAWIKEIKPATGTLQYGKTGTIVVIIDRELLSAGKNETYLVVTTKNGGGSVEVKLTAIGLDKHLAKLNVAEVTNITAATAKFNGEITDNGFPAYTERGFVYAQEPMPTVDNTLERISVSITSEPTFSSLVKGLELGKQYYVRAYAVNAEGTAYSANQVQFTTQAIPPRIEMDRISNVDIAKGTAIFHATVADAGEPPYSEKGFVYSAASSVPTIYDKKAIAIGDHTGGYDAKIEGLESNRQYHVRAYAKNEAGVVYSSNALSFSTDEVLPVVKTDAATDEDREHNSVVLHGTIVDAGKPSYAERGFVYSSIYESPTIYDDKIVVAGSGNTSFEYRSTALSSDKSYYVRAYATNSKGTAYGETIRIFAKDVIVLPTANLMIQSADIGQNNWSSINSMCENSTYEGYTDWRLPDKDELMMLYTQKDFIGGFNTQYDSTYQQKDTYWSNTTGFSSYGREGYFYLSFSTGGIYIEESRTGSKTSYRSGRCVRTLNQVD